MISALGQIAVKRHGLDETAARLLRSLFDRRSEADYGLAVVGRADAEDAVRDAETVVRLVTDWLSGRS